MALESDASFADRYRSEGVDRTVQLRDSTVVEMSRLDMEKNNK
jgi:hypothetical protein